MVGPQSIPRRAVAHPLLSRMRLLPASKLAFLLGLPLTSIKPYISVLPPCIQGAFVHLKVGDTHHLTPRSLMSFGQPVKAVAQGMAELCTTSSRSQT